MVWVGRVSWNIGFQQLADPQHAAEGPFQVVDSVHHHPFGITNQYLEHLQQQSVGDQILSRGPRFSPRGSLIEKDIPDFFKAHSSIVRHLKRKQSIVKT